MAASARPAIGAQVLKERAIQLHPPGAGEGLGSARAVLEGHQVGQAAPAMSARRNGEARRGQERQYRQKSLRWNVHLASLPMAGGRRQAVYQDVLAGFTGADLARRADLRHSAINPWTSTIMDCAAEGAIPLPMCASMSRMKLW